MVNFIAITIPDDQEGRRLDRYLRFVFSNLSQGEVEKLLRSKMIRLDGQKAKPDTRIQTGQIIKYPDFLVKPEICNADVPKNAVFPKEIILCEDNDLMVINKPHGLAVQGGSNTMHHLDQMLETLPKRNGYRPSSVHRLDKDTSGCLLIAKKRTIAAKLGEALRHHEFEKYYFGILDGILENQSGILETYLAKYTAGEQKDIMQVVDQDFPKAQIARTVYHVLYSSAETQTSLVVLSPITGRTHQLRVHCQFMGTPILGDGKYNSYKENRNSKFHKLCLHAGRLIFTHPTLGTTIDVKAPIPEHFKKTLEACRLKTDCVISGQDRDILKYLKTTLT